MDDVTGRLWVMLCDQWRYEEYRALTAGTLNERAKHRKRVRALDLKMQQFAVSHGWGPANDYYPNAVL